MVIYIEKSFAIYKSYTKKQEWKAVLAEKKSSGPRKVRIMDPSLSKLNLTKLKWGGHQVGQLVGLNTEEKAIYCQLLMIVAIETTNFH